MQKILLVHEKVMSVCIDILNSVFMDAFCTTLKYIQSCHYRYRVMTSCWNEDPSERPSFKEHTVTFEQMLEDGVEYLDLNPRIVHNRTYFTSPRDILGKCISYARRKCTS